MAPRPLASRGLRFVANVVDTLVVFGPGMLAFFVVWALAVSQAQERSARYEWFLGVALTVMTVAMMLGLGVQVAAQVRLGQSVGKRLFKMKVLRSDGTPVELWRLILLRNLVPQVLAQLCGLFGLIDAAFIFNPEQRCVHDLLADTIVVDVSGDG